MPTDARAMTLERSCAVTAVALSERRRTGARLVTGTGRRFGLSTALDTVHVPFPLPHNDWTRRTLTCGVALQCAPSKDRILDYRVNELTTRELRALDLVEARVALGLVATRWPGLLPEFQRLLPDLEVGDRAERDMVHYPDDDIVAAIAVHDQAAFIEAINRHDRDLIRADDPERTPHTPQHP